ncbi:MAG: hypothetical protein OER95_06385 [Acidimicrobiia bacterium]|nr:hypothetical protein [Acidimicrobiia bacterium]
MGDYLLAAIDANGCQEIPMLESAVQTYFNYVNGASGYVVLAVGISVILIGIFGRKWLSSLPGWLSGIILAGLAISALPAILGAFGVNVGCGGGGAVTEGAAALIEAVGLSL